MYFEIDFFSGFHGFVCSWTVCEGVLYWKGRTKQCFYHCWRRWSSNVSIHTALMLLLLPLLLLLDLMYQSCSSTFFPCTFPQVERHEELVSFGQKYAFKCHSHFDQLERKGQAFRRRSIVQTWIIGNVLGTRINYFLGADTVIHLYKLCQSINKNTHFLCSC